jgi:hypothetical protein
MWRIGPGVRVDERRTHSDGSTEMLYVPTLRVDLLRGRFLVECELGAELGRRALEQSREDTTLVLFQPRIPPEFLRP